MKTARPKGIWNNKYKAIAPPITSAISVAIIANSVKIHNTIPNVLLVLARIACAKSICETMPNLAAIYWSNIAIKLEIKIIDINKYWKFCPPVIEVDQFPGSIYPTATNAPGPE